MECTKRNLISAFRPCTPHNLIMRVLTICLVKLTQSTALEQMRFDLRSLSPTLPNLWLLLVNKLLWFYLWTLALRHMKRVVMLRYSLKTIPCNGLKRYDDRPFSCSTTGDGYQNVSLRQSPHVSVFVWKRTFFPPVLPTVHTHPVKTVTENGSFQKTLSRVEIFENAGFSFSSGRTKTGVFEYDDVIYF